ncbi:MAG: family 20 glycosylhydrolase [Opitutaceae bacterium]|nr:family 20 glycosylhydrolase [Opitutaceae bacterium]
MTALVAAGEPRPSLMPLPAEVRVDIGSLSLVQGFVFQFEGLESRRAAAAASRLSESAKLPGGSTGGVVVKLLARELAPEIPVLGIDETYLLKVDHAGVRIEAANDIGLLRGLATLRQLVAGEGRSARLPFAEIKDSPRFPWRGLMVDVCRHWIPPAALTRQIELMAAVKLNVLHLHLTEDQGFRIESKAFPRLHELGSDGAYYSHADIRGVIAFAAERGIRVVPEFDMPGHTASWLVAHPELGSLPGPGQIVRKWGIFDSVLDPTNESLYPFLDTFLGEMSALFPDAFLHIGGDEVNGVQWNANPAIRRFIRANSLGNNQGLQAHFNRRVAAILARHGKQVIGWDEVLHPDMPVGVIQSWRGTSGLAEAVRAGRKAILSHGYYIDLIHPAIEHYRADPLPEGLALTPDEQARVLGGEATMWSEWVDADTIDSRVWPRTAAIAERLWSTREACAREDDLYPRLEYVSGVLASLGSRHASYLDERLPRVAGDPRLVPALRTLVDAVEPVKVYRRMHFQPEMTSLDPLDTLADLARPDSASSRLVNDFSRRLLDDPADEKAALRLRTQFAAWAESTALLVNAGCLESRPRAYQQAREMAKRLSALAVLGQDCVEAITSRKDLAPDRVASGAKALLEASRPNQSATEFVFIPSLRRLLAAATATHDFHLVKGEAREAWLLEMTPAYESQH